MPLPKQKKEEEEKSGRGSPIETLKEEKPVSEEQQAAEDKAYVDSLDLSVADTSDHAKYTPENVVLEFREVYGRDPTRAEIDNYVQYGNQNGRGGYGLIRMSKGAWTEAKDGGGNVIMGNNNKPAIMISDWDKYVAYQNWTGMDAPEEFYSNAETGQVMYLPPEITKVKGDWLLVRPGKDGGLNTWVKNDSNANGMLG